MIKCIMSFMIQLSLVFLIDLEKSTVFPGKTFQINAARLVCAFLLHLSIITEIKTAIGMMTYITHNADQFKIGTIFHPFCIALMKLIGGFITEIMNINLICQSTSIEDVVKDFIALGIIAEIDNLMAMSISFKGEQMSEQIKNANITYPQTQKFVTSD